MGSICPGAAPGLAHNAFEDIEDTIRNIEKLPLGDRNGPSGLQTAEL